MIVATGFVVVPCVSAYKLTFEQLAEADVNASMAPE